MRSAIWPLRCARDAHLEINEQLAERDLVATRKTLRADDRTDDQLSGARPTSVDEPNCTRPRLELAGHLERTDGQPSHSVAFRGSKRSTAYCIRYCNGRSGGTRRHVPASP